MARSVDWQRREDLLERAVDHVVASGLSDFSMRAIARAVGVDPSLLSHHFGGKRQLVSQMMNCVRDRLRVIAESPSAAATSPTPEQMLDRVWSWAVDPAHEALYVLFFEVYGAALRTPQDYAPFLETVVSDWLLPLDRAFRGKGMPEGQATARATLMIAIVRGLLLDLLATGDRDRVDAALDQARSLVP
jgi:AcrR family transcriptional regulator